jgi:hypothetical protein
MKISNYYLLILDEDQNKMKVEDVFLVVEQAVMVHEQMKPYKEEVVVVVDVLVLRLLLFLVFKEKQVIFFFLYQ